MSARSKLSIVANQVLRGLIKSYEAEFLLFKYLWTISLNGSTLKATLASTAADDQLSGTLDSSSNLLCIPTRFSSLSTPNR